MLEAGLDGLWVAEGLACLRLGARGGSPAAMRLEFVHPRVSRVSRLVAAFMGRAFEAPKRANSATNAKRTGRVRINIFMVANLSGTVED